MLQAANELYTLLQEADSIQIDDDFIHNYELNELEDTHDENHVVLDMNFFNGNGDEVSISFTYGDVANAQYDPSANAWCCGDHHVSLHLISLIGQPFEEKILIEAAQKFPLNRYQQNNASTRIDGYYFPKPQEVALGKHHDAFERAKMETIANMQAAIAEVEALSPEAFFEERKRGLN